MSNRKAHRQAAQDASLASSIPLSQPDRSARPGKTLVDIATERQASLAGGQRFYPDADSIQEIQWKDLPDVSQIKNGKRSASFLNGKHGIRDGSVPDANRRDAGDDGEDPIGAFGLSLVYTITLTMLHFTLDVLAHNQYRQEIGWALIARNTAVAFLPLFGIVYLLHPRSALPLVQALFFATSLAAGGYLIYAANEEPYYAVMKRAPPLGTIWIWSVIELRVEWAVSSLIMCGAWLWWGGWSII